MKKIFFIALIGCLSMIATAQARNLATASTVPSTLSWEGIRQAGLFPSWSTVQFGNIFTTINDLCVDGDSLRPVNNARQVCTAWQSRGDDTVCTHYKTVYLSTPRLHSREVCTAWSNSAENSVCLSSETRQETYPVSYQVKVFKRTNRQSDEMVYLFTKQFDIPACGN